MTTETPGTTDPRMSIVSTPTDSEDVWLGDHEPAPQPVEKFDEVFATLPDTPRRKNRKQRRDEARRFMGRDTRRKLHGFGEWRKQ